MNHDPIFHAISLRLSRTFFFVWLSAVIAVSVWIWVLLGYFDLPWRDIWEMTKVAVTADDQHRTAALLIRGCGLAGFLTTSVIYLTTALWWRRSSDVHRRGARFIDARDGRD